MKLSVPPLLTPSQEGSQMLPMEKTWRAAPTVIQPSAPRSQQLFLDKERELQLPTPPDSGAPLSPERKAWAQAFTCLIFPSLGWQAGTALCAYLPPPSPSRLHRSLDFFFPALSPSIPERLTRNQELFCCAQQEGSLQGCCLGGGEASVSSVAQSCPTLCTPWTAALQASLPITSSQRLPKLTSIQSVKSSNCPGSL